MILEVSRDGFRTLSFGPSQFHGHGSWLVCELALGVQLLFHGVSKYSSEMFEKLRRETHIQIELPTSHYYILRVHIAE